MKPRFCTSPIGVSDAVNSACRIYSTLYDAPDEPVRSALEAYVHRLVIQGERNQHQLTVKALIYLQKREGKASQGKSSHGKSSQGKPSLVKSGDRGPQHR